MISIKDVSFTYDGGQGDGIGNVTLEIAPGECVLLCGRSGCGKTTVTRLINGLIPHFHSGELQGSVTVGDMDICQTPMYKIAEKVGSVFQNPRTQFFNVDTDSEIAFGMENLAYPPEQLRRRLDETAAELELKELMGRGIFELSGGEKQKVAFASIHAMSPEVYILDEPSSNLDVQATEELRKSLRLLKNKGKTIVIAEHRLYYLRDLVDRIIYMEGGRIAGSYSPGQFLSLPVAVREGMGLRTMELEAVELMEKAPGGAPPPAVLEARKVTVKYKRGPVVDRVELSASRGDIIGVIGHNGAGKSTFVRTLCGLNKKHEGTFRWNGREVGAKERLRLSYMVMQDVNYQLFAESVELECCLGIKNPDREAAAGVLKELDLYGCRQSHPNTLSGGQKQRTAIAVSMLCKKELLVFDEPTSGLDFDSMRQVAKLLSRLSELGKVIFVVTHDYELLAAACSHIVHFDRGALKGGFRTRPRNRKLLQDFFIS